MERVRRAIDSGLPVNFKSKVLKPPRTQRYKESFSLMAFVRSLRRG
jgi:hypothetical protein